VVGSRCLVPLLVAGCLLVPSAGAVEMSGRISSSLYGWERSDNNYWRGYIGFNSNTTFWREGRARSLSFHNNLRWTGNLATSESGIPQTYVYDVYLRLSGYPSGSTFYLGRQFAYNTLGSSLIDGLRANVRVHRTVDLDLFGGSTALHEKPEKIQNFSDYGTLGGRIEYHRSQSFRVALNWLQQKSYGSVSRHRVGVDAWKELRKCEFYGRVSYDLLNSDLAGALARAIVRPDKWCLSAELDWRKPSVDGNTVFSLIDADPYKGMRTEITRVIRRDLRLLGQFHVERVGGDNAWRTLLGLRTTRFMLGWIHRAGYGGESDGVQGQININVRPNLELYGTAFLSRYFIQPESPDKIDAYSSSAGLLWRPGSAIQIRTEGQYLRDAVDKNDVRLFVQIVKAFDLKAARSEAGR